MSPPTLVFLFFAAALGGALNAVAGGGSFIAFPSLLFAGIAPIAANATNTVALWPGAVASAVAYRREMPKDRRLLSVLAVASLLGGGAGAWLLLHTSEHAFVALIPWLLFVATALFTFGKRVTSRFAADGGESDKMLAVVAGIQLVIAVYGGYFGGGMSILILAALQLAGMKDIHTMNALKTVLGALINGVAVILFVVAGAVAWRPGSVMIAGGIAGGYAGAAVARRIEPKQVRKFVLVVAWAMTAWFFYSTYLRKG